MGDPTEKQMKAIEEIRWYAKRFISINYTKGINSHYRMDRVHDKLNVEMAVRCNSRHMLDGHKAAKFNAMVFGVND